MNKTFIFKLDEELDSWLRRRAFKLNISIAELIRIILEEKKNEP